MNIRVMSAALALGLLLFGAAAARAGTDPADACKDAKAKAAGKKASAVMKAYGKNFKKPSPARLSASISKAQSKFTKGFTKAESKGGCLTTGDSGAIEAKVDALVAEIVEDFGPACGDDIAAGAEQCDGADAPDCPGLCQPNCICPAPVCGNAVVEAGEACESPCATGGPCGVGEICGADCQCVPAAPCNCGSPNPTGMSYTTMVGPGFCGVIKDGGSNTLLDLECGQSYVGGGQLGAAPVKTPMPIGTNFYNVECCYDTTLVLTATTAAETGSIKTCSSAGCLLGAPVPTIVATIPQSVCTVDELTADVFGSADCATGEIELVAPFSAPVFLTGDLLPKRCEVGSTNEGAPCVDNSDCTGGNCLSDLIDVQPCPICNPVTLVCNGGPNDGLACTPGTPELGPEYPTSHDCPAESLLELPPSFQPLALTTGTVSKVAPDGQFFGWCRDIDTEGSLCFEGNEDATGALGCPDSSLLGFACYPASDTDVSDCGQVIPCNSDADCRAPYESCEQRSAGASDQPNAESYELSGSLAGDMTDRQPHDATLVSLHRVPPTFNSITDAAADFPGPGSASYPGEAQLFPSPSAAFIDRMEGLLE